MPLRTFIFVFVCFSFQLSAHAASFICGEASTYANTKKLVCKDLELSKLDIELSAAHQSLRGDGKQGFCMAQYNWVEQLNTCKDRLCIKNLYEVRIKDLLNIEKISQRFGIPIDICREHMPTFFDIKAWPADPSQTIVVIANHTKGNDDGVYDLDLFIQNNDDGKILRRITKEKIIIPGELSPDGDSDGISNIWLDTANYTIQKGRRAFGVRIDRGYSENSTVGHESLYLFDFQDKKMPRVLNMLVSWDSGGPGTEEGCISNIGYRTISIGRTSTKEYYDLVVTEKSMVSTNGEPDPDGGFECIKTEHSKKYTMHFDGVRYPKPPDPLW